MNMNMRMRMKEEDKGEGGYEGGHENMGLKVRVRMLYRGDVTNTAFLTQVIGRQGSQ